MAAVGRDPRKLRGGNFTKKLRFEFTDNPSAKLIERILGRGKIDARLSGRLRKWEKDMVSPYYIWHAVEKLLSSSVKHSYRDSTEWDVITNDGTRLPPKEVFGLAVSEVLGRKVLSADFESDKLIRSIIEEAGFPIVAKNKQTDSVDTPLDSEVKEWTEGGRKLVKHYHRERGFGLSKAKKEQFKRDHDGRLHCERCQMDPIEVYGSRFGEACIEVHHERPLASLPAEKQTKLQDLICVCANCHRIIHRELTDK